MSQKRKVLFFGLDAMSPVVAERLIKEGKMPTLEKLMKNGIFAEHAGGNFPTMTANVWTSVVTGAWPGTHGVTHFWIHRPGDPLDKMEHAFDTEHCNAEFIWDTAEKAGEKTVLMKYMGGWPPTIKKGIVVDGCSEGECEHEISREHLFTNIDGFPHATKVELKPAKDWKNLPSSKKPPLEFEAIITMKRTIARREVRGECPKFYGLLLASQDSGFDQILLSKTRDAEKKFALLSLNEWSKPEKMEFKPEGGTKIEGTTRFKLIELSEDAEELRLFAEQTMPIDNFGYPKEIMEEVFKAEGPFLLSPGWQGGSLGWISIETFLEQCEYQNDWMARATVHLLKNHDWTLYFMHTHTTDWIGHLSIKRYDPITKKNKEDAKMAYDEITRIYQSCDKMIKKVIDEVADENTLIIVYSDHGTMGWKSDIPIRKILSDAGLFHLKEGSQTDIDWSKTKVAPFSIGIYINLKGREPHGIVEPGEEYDKIQQQVIEALYAYKDPETGIRPVSLALRKRDARLLGLYGDYVGDIIFAVHGGFGHDHGQQLATTDWSASTMRSLLIMSGPNVKKDYRMQQTAWAVDIVPTIANILDLPVPKNTEGAVLYDALVNPNESYKRREKLIKEKERFQKAYEYQERLFHTEH